MKKILSGICLLLVLISTSQAANINIPLADSTGTVITNQGSPGADDQVSVSDSTTATTWRALPDCTDAAGKHLNYTASSNIFSCGTSALNNVYSPSETLLSGAKIVFGQCTLDGGATATCTFTVAYTTSTSYVCAASTQTNTNSVKVARTNNTTVTVTSAVTLDVGVVNLVCVGT